LGAAVAVIALVIVIGFAVSYSPAEPTEPKSTLPVFGGTTEIPGATTIEGPATGATPETTSTPAATPAGATSETTTASAATGSGASGDDSAGKAVFAANCASCHAADGTGGVGPDLTTLPAAADPAVVAKQVQNGGAIMPAFSGKLSDQEIQDVAAYVSQELAKH
jgi:mono/diheme cytochrome c family protein